VLILESARTWKARPGCCSFPAIFLAVTLFCSNFIGDGLCDALDPKDR
jgi:oligopeptide transport system permease protein